MPLCSTLAPSSDRAFAAYVAVDRLLPDVIGDLGNLIELNLTQNKLQWLPARMARLCKLKALLVVDNELDHIPSFAMVLRQLQVLDLSLNRISSFPGDVGRLSGLRTFHYEGNPFHTPMKREGGYGLVQQVPSLKEACLRALVDPRLDLEG
jgi:Leucine-rich repeat (LRR) protein